LRSRDIGFDGKLSKGRAGLETVCGGILHLFMPCKRPLGPVDARFMVYRLVGKFTVVAMSRKHRGRSAPLQSTRHLEVRLSRKSERVIEGNDALPSSVKVAGRFHDQEALLSVHHLVIRAQYPVFNWS
jgi:hypothetical protein